MPRHFLEIWSLKHTPCFRCIDLRPLLCGSLLSAALLTIKFWKNFDWSKKKWFKKQLFSCISKLLQITMNWVFGFLELSCHFHLVRSIWYYLWVLVLWSKAIENYLSSSWYSISIQSTSIITEKLALHLKENTHKTWKQLVGLQPPHWLIE